MLVVISDLHFEEEARAAIPGTKPPGHNLPSIAFERFAAEVALQAQRNDATRIDLVLAGDIFDLHRTQLWFDDPLRPYPDPVPANSPLEAKILGILGAIAREPSVDASLKVFRRFANGEYLGAPGDPSSVSRLGIPVVLTYLPGNHDRLLNATPGTRAAAASLLGIPPPADSFPHVFTPPGGSPRVLVRHGHEYDRFNFAVDHSSDTPFPSALPAAEYDRPTFGDCVTIDVASRLPHLFRTVHGDAAIAADPAVLTPIYLRLLEFDDVRPQSALLDFLLALPGSPLGADAIWDRLKPVVLRLLDEVSENGFFRDQLSRLRPGLLDPFRVALGLKFWKLGLPLGLARRFADGLKSAGSGDGAERFAAREDVIASGAVRFVIAGHTHEPQLAPVGHVAGEDRYYVDTGTWRNRLLSPPDRSTFERVKSLTYVIVYASDEDPGRSPTPGKDESFDYWSGFTQRWPLA